MAITIFLAPLIATLILSTSVTAQEFDVKTFLDKTYIKVGAGYKFRELNLIYMNEDGTEGGMNSPISARLEIGYQWNDNITIGYAHRSQWQGGMPEYYCDEVFIDYKVNLGDLF